MAKADVYCGYCHQSEQVKGHGKGKGGHPRYRCYTVRSFSWKYPVSNVVDKDGEIHSSSFKLPPTKRQLEIH
ncbi:IS1 family transposase [Xenorhabdus nematophila]|uniref:IS1 family transposase n=1 Tax=Xenorhabdus nematophila TaxID=628 RepID=UPI00117CA83E